jgi:hypothetical protein
MRKPNYRFERAERDGMNQVKKEETRGQKEKASQQISEEPGQPTAPAASDNGR